MERRAIEVKKSLIFKYAKELNSLSPFLHQLLFLDEVSIDSRSMLKKKGYFPTGGSSVIEGKFNREKRISLLCFANCRGFFHTTETEGTFTRLKFFNAIRELIKSGRVSTYPGPNSIWIMDGAAIHMDPEIVYYLRSVGLKRSSFYLPTVHSTIQLNIFLAT